jgi:hypothetical protein
VAVALRFTLASPLSSMLPECVFPSLPARRQGRCALPQSRLGMQQTCRHCGATSLAGP